jgi:hypothetical protein
VPLNGRFKWSRFRLANNESDSGFMLLDIMIAFAIIALVTSTLYRATIGGLQLTSEAANYEEALSLIKSHLAEIGCGGPISTQNRSGIDGEGFTWTLVIGEHGRRLLALSDEERTDRVGPATAVLYDIAVTESWGDGRSKHSLTIKTHRIGIIQELTLR